MPQLVKGGKNAFGWSGVSLDGKIAIPPDAYTEYHFTDGEKLILISGSKKSGGFGLSKAELIKKSEIFDTLSFYPDLMKYNLNEGEAIRIKNKIYSWVSVQNRSIKIPFKTLELYGIKKGDSLLTVRGSKLALGFIVRGPIIEEAKSHPELKEFK
jgi:hypothetical protein